MRPPPSTRPPPPPPSRSPELPGSTMTPNRHPPPPSPSPSPSPQPPNSTMRPNHRRHRQQPPSPSPTHLPPTQPRHQPPPPPAHSPRPSNSTTTAQNYPQQPPPPSPHLSNSPRRPQDHNQPHHPPHPAPSPTPPEPTFLYYPSYPMPPPPKRRRSGGCASCMLATAFLFLVAIIAIVACFVLFKPQDPKIAVNSVRFPAFSLSNGTIDFTFFQYVAVRNPNRYSFSHYDSSLQLFYSGSQLGFMFIPAGEIAPGQTQYVSATFNVRSIPVANQAYSTTAVSGAGAVLAPGVGPTLEVETKMKMAGRVRVLKLLAHHVESSARCRVTMEVSNGNVLGFHC